MNSKQLVFECIEGKDWERTPVLLPMQALYANYLKGVTNADVLKKPLLSAKAQIEFMDYCKVDGVEVVHDAFTMVEACGARVNIPDYWYQETVEVALKDPEKIDRLEVPDPLKDARFVSALELANILMEMKGSEYFSVSTIIAPFTLAGELRGLKNFLFDMHFDRHLVSTLIERSTEIIKEYLLETAKLGLDAMLMSDPTASERLFDSKIHHQFVLPTAIECSKLCINEKKKSIWHICDKSPEQFRQLKDTNIDIVHISSKVRPISMSEALPGKVILGNLSTEGILSYGTEEEVAEEAYECLGSMVGRRYILGAGCAPFETTKVENIKSMRVCSDNYSIISM